jgi:hypothetical protein
MRTHCGHSTQLFSLRDTRNAGKDVAQCSSSVRAGLTGSCVCCTLLYGAAFWNCRCWRSLCSPSIAVRKTQQNEFNENVGLPKW